MSSHKALSDDDLSGSDNYENYSTDRHDHKESTDEEGYGTGHDRELYDLQIHQPFLGV